MIASFVICITAFHLPCLNNNYEEINKRAAVHNIDHNFTTTNTKNKKEKAVHNKTGFSKI